MLGPSLTTDSCRSYADPGAVARGRVHVAERIDRQPGARSPHGPAQAVRIGLEAPQRAGAGLRLRDDPAVVAAAVAGVAAVAEHHLAVVDCQPGALQQLGRVRAGRVDGHRQPLGGRAGDDVVADEAVVDRGPVRAVPGLGHRVDPVRGRVDHRRPGDPDRADVAAPGGRDLRDRRAGVLVPDDPAGGGIERVDRVVLGRDVHVGAVDERLPVNVAVERGARLPRLRGPQRRRAVGVDAGLGRGRGRRSSRRG